MRNLKKILALVLALVMSFSLMATANAFTDDEKITDTYETAVTVLSGLKVFQGYDDGSFMPQGPITRAEVAAIIYRIVTGDVADTQVGIYADYNKFNDVKSTSWYAGYVNFCANAEYIKGYDAKTFGPNDPVTGYQALAMILRALGYDKNGEFTGTSWQVQTAAVGENRGITKNISAGTLGTAATREVVAEILFRAILVEKVNYTPAFGYQLDDTSLGWDTFELEEISGIVVANEYADLYGASALKAGKTELDVDGESYMLNYTTAITDIGEARDAYITEGKTVLYIADGGNTVFETGAETNLSTSKKFEDATGLERDEDVTEEFINFSNEAYEYVTDIRISYRVFDENGNIVDEDVFPKDHKLTSAEVEILENIFRYDDENDGWVVVGTKELIAANDISDDMTWKTFCKEYFQDTDSLIDEVNESENGEWLKVIDNDGDGVADYVLKTEFAMAEITNITSKGVYTISALSNDDAPVYVPDTDDELDVDEEDIVTEDELAEGDIVVYTLIDGNYYVDIAEMVTGTVDKKGINSKTETMTVDGTDYVQSHIGYSDACSYNYYDNVTQGHTEETYDLYLDHFGYVRLFAESEYNKGFVLLTDGYYWTDNRDETFKATIYDLEAEELVDVDLKDDDNVTFFIDDSDEGANGSRGTWDRLKEVDETYGAFTKDGYITNIAAYTVSDDVYAINDAENASNREDYYVHEVDTDGIELDDRNLDSLNWNDADTNEDWRIQTVTGTQYYLVVKDSDGDIDQILTWVGYKNAPDAAELGSVTYAYAVTHESDSGAYDVADVVVFETNTTADRDTYFVYEANNWQDLEHVWGIGYGEDDTIVDERINVDDANDWLWYGGPIQFYVIDKDGNVPTFINKDYDEYYIYAGEVDVIDDTTKYDYFQVADTAEGDLYFSPEKGADEYAPIYQVVVDKRGNYDVEMVDDWADIDLYSAMILFTDKDQNVEYAIYVERDITDDDYIGLVEDLYDAIVADANYSEYTVTLTNNVANTTATLTDEAGKAVVSGDKVEKGTKLTLTVKENQGYNGTDYFVEVNNVEFKLVDGRVDITVNSNTTITVQGEDAAATQYEVWYKVDETMATKPADTAWNVNTTGAIPAPEMKDGYTFDGWYMDEALTEAVTDYSQLEEADFVDGTNKDGKDAVILYAKTTANDITVTFNYYNPDGALIVANTQTVTFKTDKQPVNVVLGTDRAYVYALNGVGYEAGDEYAIDNLTKDTTFAVTVHDARTTVVADDSEALQEALADSEVDTIYLQDDDYKVGANVSRDVTIIGNGETTIVFENYGENVPCGIFVDSGADLVIEGVTFEGGTNGIMFCGDSLTVKNCTFKNTSGAGIYLCENSSIKGAYIEGCTFKGCGANIAIASPNSLADDATVIISSCKVDQGSLYDNTDPSMESQIIVK